MSAAKHTPGPWIIATSNSWRRIVSQRGESVCEPIKQNDGHPDLYFRNGGADGPDASLIAAAPEGLDAAREALIALAMVAAPDSVTVQIARKKLRAFIAKAEGGAA